MLSVEARVPLRDFELALALEVKTGCLALAGPSGAGKTTLLRVVAGLTRPREGRVAVNGEVWTDAAAGVFVPAELRRCGYLFQDYALFPHLSAWRNVAYGLPEVPRRLHRRDARVALGIRNDRRGRLRPAPLDREPVRRVPEGREVRAHDVVDLVSAGAGRQYLGVDGGELDAEEGDSKGDQDDRADRCDRNRAPHHEA